MEKKIKETEEIKQEYIDWLKGIVNRLNVDGVWYSPSLGTTFRKTAENELTLEQITSTKDNICQVNTFIEKTKKIADKAEIKIIIRENNVTFY